DVVSAIREVVKGNAYFSPAIAKRLREQTTHPSAEAKQGVELTQREAEVLQLIAEGYANKQIAAELNLSVKTVEKHRQQVMPRLAARFWSAAVLRRFRSLPSGLAFPFAGLSSLMFRVSGRPSLTSSSREGIPRYSVSESCDPA